MKEEILGGLKNALERGTSLEDAVQSFINSGYNVQEVHEAARFLSQGANSMHPQTQSSQPVPSQTPHSSPGQPPRPQMHPKLSAPQPKVAEKPAPLPKANKPSSHLDSSIPGLVKVISILTYLAAICTIFIGGFYTVLGILLVSNFAFNFPSFIPSDLLTSSTSLAFSVGIGLLVLGIFLVFVAHGLWKSSNWSRISLVLLSFIAILVAWIPVNLESIPSIVSYSISILILLAISLYLLIGKKAKASFKAPKMKKPETRQKQEKSHLMKIILLIILILAVLAIIGLGVYLILL